MKKNLLTPSQRKIQAMSKEQILVEYTLILDKKSSLSSNDRKIVVRMAEHLENE